ncbi:hypothetical protein B9Z55_001321 [Caenorhabditis nigoni]|uniref:Uncharacterized protein n=2 Tax=Caenorhabditis nigoni TaxID=1611254 RepID=A0A2G5VF63_9PELO|nr:hypothetical protein B9Z55_001321 [Caenorhabditis nigoni]
MPRGSLHPYSIVSVFSYSSDCLQKKNPSIRMKSLFWILVLLACSPVLCKRRVSRDEEAVSDPEKDAADLELAKTTATAFAADLMKVRTSEDIHDLTNWLSDNLIFQLCDNRLYKSHFVAFTTHALIEEEKFPVALTLEVDKAFTRGDGLSMIVNAKGFVFEDNDQLILDFKKDDDGKYKLAHGTILTCRYE